MHARPDPTRRLAEGLRALGDETRLRILGLLTRRPHYGEELAESLGLTPATISHHIKALESYLGVQLFHRLNKGLAQTDSVLAGLLSFQRGFDKLTEAAELM